MLLLAFFENFPFFNDWANPDVRYQLLEPLLSWGIGLTLLFFLVGTLTGEKKIQIFALIAFILCCFSIIPYREARYRVAIRPVQYVQNPIEKRQLNQSFNYAKHDRWFIMTGVLGIATAIFIGWPFGKIFSWALIVVGAGLVYFSAKVSLDQIEANNSRLRIQRRY